MADCRLGLVWACPYFLSRGYDYEPSPRLETSSGYPEDSLAARPSGMHVVSRPAPPYGRHSTKKLGSLRSIVRSLCAPSVAVVYSVVYPPGGGRDCRAARRRLDAGDATGR